MDASTRPGVVHDVHDVQAGIWVQGPSLNRGRTAKDPQVETTTYDNLGNIQAFQEALRRYLDCPPTSPEHAECCLSFYIGTSFTVPLNQPRGAPGSSAQQHAPLLHSQPLPSFAPASGLEAHYAVASTAITALEGSRNKSANGIQQSKVSLSILEALGPTPDPKERMKRQRAIAKVCVDAVQAVDGYRYSFHNNWNSREDDAFRFSYYCNDSFLNKDRAANGKGTKYGKRACKPVYDCRGVLSVKFSAIKSTLEVFYRHNPLHKTYEERAPPPRRDSKRRKWLEDHNPTTVPPPKRHVSLDTAGLEAKKRKRRDSQKMTSGTSIEADLRAQSLQSLLDLIRTDSPPSTAPTFDVPDASLVVDHNASRRRSRISCDLCRMKRIKCDGGNPKCGTCEERNRDCVYSDRSIEGIGESIPSNQCHLRTPSEGPIRIDTLSATASVALSDLDQGLPSSLSSMSELDKMRAELAEAKQRIIELEAEKQKAEEAQQPTPTSTVHSHHDGSGLQFTPQPPSTRMSMFSTSNRINGSLFETDLTHAPTTLQHNPSLHSPDGLQAANGFDRHNPWQQQPYYPGYQPAQIHPPRTNHWVQRNQTLYP